MFFMQKPVLVIKLGSAVITTDEGTIDQSIIKKLAKEIADLSTTYRVVLVSSGAVGSGKAFIKNYKGTLIERKAAAAVGNPILIQLYHKHFSKFGITVAQALCERHHFSSACHDRVHDCVFPTLSSFLNPGSNSTDQEHPVN